MSAALSARSCLPWPIPAHTACTYARRYTALDVYGLAAGLATSWAALVASRPDCLETSLAYDMLANSARYAHFVSPCLRSLRRAALHRQLHRKPRTVQVAAMWCETTEADAWGEAAILTQYHPSLSAVLLWLVSSPFALLPCACAFEVQTGAAGADSKNVSICSAIALRVRMAA